MSRRYSDAGWLSYNSSVSSKRFPIVDSSRDFCVQGELYGGNLSSLYLLFGTPYFQLESDTILIIEDDDESSIDEFTRRLVSLIQQDFFCRVKAILFGTFRGADLEEYQKRIREVVPAELPVVSGLCFGHIYPQVSIPIGREVRVRSAGEGYEIKDVD